MRALCVSCVRCVTCALLARRAEHLSEGLKRRFYKNWYRARKKAFTRYQKKIEKGTKDPKVEAARIKKHCAVVRVICHTQVNLINGLRLKKAHIQEIQINGGSVSDKVDFG